MPRSSSSVVGAPRISSKKISSPGRARLEAQRRLAHFADALAQRRDVFGAEMGVQAESHLEFVDRFGRDSRSEDLVQALEGIMVTLEPADAFLDGEARLGGLSHRTDPGNRRQILKRAIVAHVHKERPGQMLPHAEKLPPRSSRRPRRPESLRCGLCYTTAARGALPFLSSASTSAPAVRVRSSSAMMAR